MSKHYKTSKVSTFIPQASGEFLFDPDLSFFLYVLALSISLLVISNAALHALPPEVLSDYTNFLRTIISNKQSIHVFSVAEWPAEPADVPSAFASSLLVGPYPEDSG